MTNCSVCLDSLTTGPITALLCGHVFHHECISLWIARQPHCPLCKKPIAQHHRTPLIPLYLELTGQPVLQDSSTLSVSIISQNHSRELQYRQLQSQLQSTMQKLRTERQQFEKEKRKYNNEIKDYQRMKAIKGVLELESGLSEHQLQTRIQNWKALPHDQLVDRMGAMAERQGHLSRELDDTEIQLHFSQKRIQQLKERLALSRRNQNGCTLPADSPHFDSPDRLKRRRSSSSTGDVLSAKKLAKQPAIYLDSEDGLHGDDGVFGTKGLPTYIQQNGQSSSSGGSSGSGGDVSSSGWTTRQQVKCEVLTPTDAPDQQVVSIIDSDDECTPISSTSSKAIIGNTYTRSTRNTRSPQLIVILSDDDEPTGQDY